MDETQAIAAVRLYRRAGGLNCEVVLHHVSPPMKHNIQGIIRAVPRGAPRVKFQFKTELKLPPPVGSNVSQFTPI